MSKRRERGRPRYEDEELEDRRMMQSLNQGNMSPAIRNGLAKVQLTYKQQQFVDVIKGNDITFCQGPSGTAKTFTALYAALDIISSDDFCGTTGISLTKPIQEAGEKIGYLPGDLSDKIQNYMESFTGNILKLVGPMASSAISGSGIIEMKPLAYQRGINQDGKVMLLDEAQNASFEQLMLFLTRMGKDSKCVIFGDVTQADIDKKRVKLPDFIKIMRGIPNVGFFEFEASDVMRHPTLKAVIEQYERYMHSKLY